MEGPATGEKGGGGAVNRVLIALVALLIVGAVLLLGLTSSGISVFGVGYHWNEEAAEVEELAYSFLEDVKYKDFDKASRYHTYADQDEADIPKLIERLFQVPPEKLNIHDIRIAGVDMDRDGERARTRFVANIEVLNSKQKNKKKGQDPDEAENEEREVEGILYWHRRPITDALPPGSLQVIDPAAEDEDEDGDGDGDGDGDAEDDGERTAEATAALPGEQTPQSRSSDAVPKAWFMKLESSLH